jgi:hypothetical protein
MPVDPLSIGVSALMALGGAGLNYLGASGNRRGQAQPGGFQYLPYPIRPEYQEAGEFFRNAMQRTQEGRAPVWFERWRPTEEARNFQDIYATYYGGDVTGIGGQPGSPVGRRFSAGILDTQRAADVAAGRRGEGAGTNYAAQLEQYARELADARQLMGQLEAQTIGQTGATSAQQLAAMYDPRRMGEYQAYAGRPYQPSGLEQLGTAISSFAPYAGNLFQQPTTPPTGGRDYFEDYFRRRPEATPFDDVGGGSNYLNYLDFSNYFRGGGR